MDWSILCWNGSWLYPMRLHLLKKTVVLITCAYWTSIYFTTYRVCLTKNLVFYFQLHHFFKGNILRKHLHHFWSELEKFLEFSKEHHLPTFGILRPTYPSTTWNVVVHVSPAVSPYLGWPWCVGRSSKRCENLVEVFVHGKSTYPRPNKVMKTRSPYILNLCCFFGKLTNCRGFLMVEPLHDLKNILTYWFPLVRPAIKPLFLKRGTLGGWLICHDFCVIFGWSTKHMVK